ncbi:MAG: DUF5110 domain-containing protein [Chloroflexaceae bacterium]|nr:DUF5110 domain-containing protein [Chloroflexaceae bacterium]
MREQHLRVVTIIDPGVQANHSYSVYREGLEQGMFIRTPAGDLFEGYVWPGLSVFPDFSRVAVRAWWGAMVAQWLNDYGISGIWNDMNEPAIFLRPDVQGPADVGTIASDAVQGATDEATTHAELHNLYGQGMAQATHEGLRQASPDQRPFVVGRSGFAGIQRWTAAWMGDNTSWWEHIEMMLPQLMNMGMSGVPFAGVDIGGFFMQTSAELLARWYQAGILQPFCRNHDVKGMIPQEPWVFGPEIEAICRDYLNLRYRLMPYLYTLFWETSHTGAPLLRPLLYHFPADLHGYPIHDQTMLGPWLLAAPVYRPGQVKRMVYLPAGTWYDWWTDEVLEGPTHLLADAPLERMPLYVRAGAILPSGPAMQYTDEKPLNPLTLDIYPGMGIFTLYEDDGISFAYQQGDYCTTTYELVQDGGRLTLTIGERVGNYTPPPRDVVVRVHNVATRPDTTYPTVQYDAEQRLLTLRFADDGTARVIAFE